jgi:hypothetical protein
MPPAPVLDDLRNDLALLLADDLEPALRSGRENASTMTTELAPAEPVGFVDLMVGLWAWGRELASAVEIAAGLADLAPQVVQPAGSGTLDGPVLR